MFKKTDILFYKESCSLSFVIIASLALIVIFVKLATFSELIFASQNIFTTLSLIFFYLLPPILTTILPISVFTACTLVALRMSVDKEMEALFSSGMSVLRILLTPLIIGLLTMILMFLNSIYYEPYSKKQFQFFKWFQARQIVESYFVNNITEKTFISDFPLIDKNKVLFYSDSVSKKNIMSNIFIAMKSADAHLNHIFIASKGQFFKTTSNGSSDFILNLRDCRIYSENGIMSQFSDMNFSLLHALDIRFKSPGDLKTESVPITNKLRPFSAALCSLFFPVLGVCLSMVNTRNKSFKIYFGIGFIILAFYSLLILCRVVTLDYHISPYLVFSMPPIIFFCLTIWLIRERCKIK